MAYRIAFVFLAFALGAASCDKRPSYAEFQTRSWQNGCSRDSDCVLVPVPCDHCGEEDSINASVERDYRELAAKVNCDDYSTEDECGSRIDMEPACVSGRCAARVATVAEELAEEPDPCAELRSRALAILSTPSASCGGEGDCTCYPAFIDCGGVRDTASAEQLRTIAEEGRAANCGYVSPQGATFNCAPSECTPLCDNGTCRNE